MRILLHSPPPWAPSGYGKQANLLSQGLRDLGHNVAISSYAGVHEERKWNGIQILNCGGKEYGNGLIRYNMDRWSADVLIIICDAFSIEPSQLKGMTVLNWMPVDCEPLSGLDKLWLQHANAAADIHPIAMSRFGQQMLLNEGQASTYIPHAVDTSIYFPGDGAAWRVQQKIPQDCFLISHVGVNGGRPERKAFSKQLQAFKIFSDKYKSAAFYMHTMAQNNNGVDLVKISLSLDLKGRVAFCDQERRNADDFDEEYMAGMFRASNIYSSPSMGEGFGLPIIEAQACGTPVVATRASAMTELVPANCGKLVNGDKEWYFLHDSWWVKPSVQEIARAYELIYNDVTKSKMSKACVRNASQYKTENIIQMWEEKLRSL